MDSDINCRTIHFLPLDSLNVNYKLLAIDLDDLANLLAFVVTSNNLCKQTYLQFVKINSTK